MRLIAVFATLFVMGVSAAGAEPPLASSPFVSVYQDLDAMCRGWPGKDQHTTDVCAVRDKVSKALQGMGLCYETMGSIWRRCDQVPRSDKE